MDPVRFGRALGAGARAAAKTVVQAADAATAPNPSPTRTAPSGPAAHRGASQTRAEVLMTPAEPPLNRGTAAAQRPDRRAPETAARGLREGARRFGREVWRPATRLSGVLALEFAGVFFGIFALFALGSTIKLRSAWHTAGTHAGDRQRLLGAIAMFLVFAYFSMSSFVRAKRRERAR